MILPDAAAAIARGDSGCYTASAQKHGASTGEGAPMHTNEDINRSRRRLLKAGALAAGGCGLAASSIGRAFTDKSATPLAQLNYGQVQLQPGPLERQARENHRLVLDLDEDGLLRPFRIRAGLAAPGQDLGG